MAIDESGAGHSISSDDFEERRRDRNDPYGTLDVLDPDQDDATDEWDESPESRGSGADYGRGGEEMPPVAAPVGVTGLKAGPGGYEMFLPEFREHFQAHYHPQGGEFSDYDAAYQFGYDMAVNPSLSRNNWDTVSYDAAGVFDARYGEGAWDRFKDSVRYAWDKVRGRG